MEFYVLDTWMTNTKETSLVALIPLVQDLGLSWLEISTNSFRKVMTAVLYQRLSNTSNRSPKYEFFSFHLDNVNS